jgi:predicted RNA-binding protein YlxR (DUF448 family)
MFPDIPGILGQEGRSRWVHTDRKEINVADVHVYVNRTAAKEGTALEDVEEALRKLDYVSHVEANPEGNVVVVSFEGGKAEQ